MPWKRKVTGGVLAVLGFLLSPLSWWNDAFVNLPLALAFAWLVSWFYKPAFTTCLVVGYWLTNVLGLVLLHQGTRKLAGREPPPHSRADWMKDVGISLAYTGLILALVKTGVLKPIANYFP